jgi:hypothetical protein
MSLFIWIEDSMNPLPDSTSAAVEEFTPRETSHSADGVDLTLIRWMLSLTPDQRLDLLDRFASDILEMRNGNASV